VISLQQCDLFPTPPPPPKYEWLLAFLPHGTINGNKKNGKPAFCFAGRLRMAAMFLQKPTNSGPVGRRSAFCRPFAISKGLRPRYRELW